MGASEMAGKADRPESGWLAAVTISILTNLSSLCESVRSLASVTPSAHLQTCLSFIKDLRLDDLYILPLAGLPANTKLSVVGRVRKCPMTISEYRMDHDQTTLSGGWHSSELSLRASTFRLCFNTHAIFLLCDLYFPGKSLPISQHPHTDTSTIYQPQCQSKELPCSKWQTMPIFLNSSSDTRPLQESRRRCASSIPMQVLKRPAD